MEVERLVCTLTVIGALVTGFMASALADDRPNVIFILTDDQRYDEMGFMNPVLNTPHIDELARDGVHFRNAFVTTSLCSPSRASILSGQMMHNHGVVDNNAALPEGLELFPSRLQAAGSCCQEWWQAQASHLRRCATLAHAPL